MDLDTARLQCAAWQRKATNYRHIAANIMSKLSSYKQQIRSLMLAHTFNSDSTRTSFDVPSFLDDDHTETFSIVTDEK